MQQLFFCYKSSLIFIILKNAKENKLTNFKCDHTIEKLNNFRFYFYSNLLITGAKLLD